MYAVQLDPNWERCRVHGTQFPASALTWRSNRIKFFSLKHCFTTGEKKGNNMASARVRHFLDWHWDAVYAVLFDMPQVCDWLTWCNWSTGEKVYYGQAERCRICQAAVLTVITVVELLFLSHVMMSRQHCVQIRNLIKNNCYGCVIGTEI